MAQLSKLAEMKAETERLIMELESKIEEAKETVAEITESGDESRYWVRSLFEMQIRSSESLIEELREDDKCLIREK